MHTGGCLCGAVRYEIVGDLAPIQFCHCAMCRRASGAAFAANMPVRVADFRVTRGQEALKRFESSPGKSRVFCGGCGAPIISRSLSDPGMVRVRAGGLDEPSGAVGGFHFYVDDAAAWAPMDDTLPRHPGARPR
jgi:hypothetical protein